MGGQLKERQQNKQGEQREMENKLDLYQQPDVCLYSGFAEYALSDISDFKLVGTELLTGQFAMVSSVWPKTMR